MTETTRDTAGLSIGALSQATGVPVETLRTWERRYGYPSPERSPNGHRLYPTTTVRRVELIVDAIQRGNRAAQVVPLSVNELESLIGIDRRREPRQENRWDKPLDEALVHWLETVADLDERAFDRTLRDEWNRLGGQRFLVERAAPFIVAVGHEWAAGRFTVLHEHFASERLRDFLTSQWRPLSDTADGPPVFCTTLPREAHGLGLHFAATVVALAGCRIQYFGLNTPIDAVAAGVEQAPPAAIIVSVSATTDGVEAEKYLEELRSTVPSGIEIVLGGSGAPRGIRGARLVSSLNELRDWAEDRAGAWAPN